MPQFIKLTRVTGWKVGEDKKRVATETKSVYIRPSEITQFSDDGDYTYVTLGDGSITVTEKADEIYRMIDGSTEDKHYYIPNLHENWRGNWWGTDWWKDQQITTWGTSSDYIIKNLPYYTTTIVYTNGDIWE